MFVLTINKNNSIWRAGLAPLFLAVCTLITSACQKPPKISPAAKPSARLAARPMGSETSNMEFERTLQLFAALLDGKISKKEISKVKMLKPGFKDLAGGDERVLALSRLLADLPDAMLSRLPIAPGIERDLLIAQLHFKERRFIKASHLLSQILDRAPKFPNVRNMLARCFYFLGNPDRTIKELEYILVNQSENPDEFLDALFLMGAAVLEKPYSPKNNVKKAIAAWETYLKVAQDSPQKEHVENGLKQLRERLDESSTLAQKTAASTNKQKPRTSSSAAPDFGQLRAEGLKAFSNGDLLKAQGLLQDALKQKGGDPEVLTTLGRIYVKRGQTDQAFAKFSQVTKQNPEHLPGWHYMGMAHIMRGDAQKAIECWQRVVKTDPKYANRYQLGQRIAVAQNMANQR